MVLGGGSRSAHHVWGSDANSHYQVSGEKKRHIVDSCTRQPTAEERGERDGGTAGWARSGRKM